MQRSRLIAPLAGLAAALAAGPILATVALAADPTVVVQPGDTLTRISKRQHVSIDTLVDLNDLADPNRIYVGQRLRVGVEPAAQPAASSAPAAAAALVHTVKPGQNLTSIARGYGVTIAAIVEANAITNPSRIYAGQRLIIPGSAPAAAGPAPASPAPAPAKVHTVTLGQNLTSISRAYGVTIAAIVQANGLTDPSRIYAGQRLSIPSRATPAAASAPEPSMPASMAALVAKRDAVRRVIVEEADRYKVPPAFALAVAWQESGWQQSVVSHAGAVGVMQLMPATAVWVGDAMLGARVDIDDTRQNVRAGVRLLAHYLAHYKGDRDRVLAAYYQGQWATDHHGIYAVSRPYIASIRVLTRLFGG
ncbi:MAG: LysM peptidoglycan-binding domain-containing protein [Candidatus Limnocylindria bacterium]